MIIIKALISNKQQQHTSPDDWAVTTPVAASTTMCWSMTQLAHPLIQHMLWSLSRVRGPSTSFLNDCLSGPPSISAWWRVIINGDYDKNMMIEESQKMRGLVWLLREVKLTTIMLKRMMIKQTAGGNGGDGCLGTDISRRNARNEGLHQHCSWIPSFPSSWRPCHMILCHAEHRRSGTCVT